VTRQGLRRASAADSFRQYLAFKENGDEQNALVTDAQKRLAR
jgi:hypothetical protein